MVAFQPMDAREARPQRGSAPQSFTITAAAPVNRAVRRHPLAELLWAGAASTLRRLQRGEGALLAVNLSLIAYQGIRRPEAVIEAVVSILTIGVMYALNDLYDAPTDSNNPKKDRRLIAIYLAHRQGALAMIVLVKLAVLVLAWTMLGPRATIAVLGALGANVAYSAALKGMPVVDVVWCGLWGALYAAIVSGEPGVWLLVGLMTAVCHLYQALDDRDADAANAITTTAVCSGRLSAAVLALLCTGMVAALASSFGLAAALTAFLPLAIHLSGTTPRTGWLLTKGYFAVMWLAVLELHRAAG
jgi:4-hydroxybenzoate polyprenyltransferase